jgi:hypothetical protein
MRRAALGILVGLLAPAPGYADTPDAPSNTSVSAEGGAEADTNVTRVESRPGNERIAAGVVRLGAKLEHKGKLAGGAYVLRTSGLARLVSRDEGQSESIGFAIGDLRWARPVGTRPVSAGIALSAADASSLERESADSRTFRSLGTDGLLLLRGETDATLSLALGVRSFTYKPDPKFDWIAPALNLRLDWTLWQPSGGTRSIELGAYAGVEARAYDSNALANAPCPEEAMMLGLDSCPAGTSLLRRDRYTRVGADLTWVSPVVATVGYQVSVTDSNSFGQSLVRHRITVSATTALPFWKLYGTALATLQFDQYLDGLIIQEDLQNQQFTTVEDENRSSLQLRVARAVSTAWSIESRAAIWRDLDNDNDTTFRRAILYIGGIYVR